MKIDLEGETVSIEELAEAWRLYKRMMAAKDSLKAVLETQSLNEKLMEAFKNSKPEPDPQGL